MATFSNADVNSSAVIQSRAGIGLTQKTVKLNFNTLYATAAVTKATSNDVIQAVKIPAGATVLGITVRAGIIDGAGATTAALSVSVGDGNDVDRFIAAFAVNGTANGVAGYKGLDDLVSTTISVGAVETGAGYKYTSEDTIDILVTGTSASLHTTNGVLVMTVLYTMDE